MGGASEGGGGVTQCSTIPLPRMTTLAGADHASTSGQARPHDPVPTWI